LFSLDSKENEKEGTKEGTEEGVQQATATAATAAAPPHSISSDVVALGLALLTRILHSFLRPPHSLPPPSSSSSSSSSSAFSRTEEEHRFLLLTLEIIKTAAPLIATAATVQQGMESLFCLAKAERKSHPTHFLSAVTHTMQLLAQCSSSSSSCASSFLPSSSSSPALLASYPRLEQWVAAFTLKVPAAAVRQAVARVLFSMCVEEIRASRSRTSARKGQEVLPLLLQVMVPRVHQVGREGGREGGWEGRVVVV